MNIGRGLIAAVILSVSVLLSQISSPHVPPVVPSSTHLTVVSPRTTHQPIVSWLRPGNLHFVFHSHTGCLKVFTFKGELICRVPCKNETFGIGFFHWGACPHGTFRLGRAVSVNAPAFGKFFVPLYDLSLDGPMHQYGRTGIGLHGGGSRLANPFDEYQRLLKTHGCLRVSNHDLKRLVLIIHRSRAKGRVSYITVQ